MASLDFPSNPTNGQTYALNGVTYYYNSTIGAWLTQLTSMNIASSSNTQVLFNDAGLANGSVGLTFNKVANTVTANTVTINNKLGIGVTTEPDYLIQAQKTDNDAIISIKTSGAGAYFHADSSGNDGYFGLSLRSAGVEKWFVGSYGSSNFEVKRTGNTHLYVSTGGDTYINSGKTLYFNNSINTAYGYVKCSGGGSLSLGSYSTEMLTLYEASTIQVKYPLDIQNGLHAKRTFTGSGNYSAATWYDIANSGNLTEAGIYIIRGYFETHGAGGGFYEWSVATVPFYWFTGGTNSTTAFTFPTAMGSGHADNGRTWSFRIRQTAGNVDGKSYVEFQTSENTTGINNTGGRKINFFFHRIG